MANGVCGSQSDRDGIRHRVLFVLSLAWTRLHVGTELPPMLSIEIEPRTAGSEFWAFVSITNNETQHLTLVTPP